MEEILKKVTAEIQEGKRGDARLVVLVRNDKGGWDFVIAADWIDDEGIVSSTIDRIHEVIAANGVEINKFAPITDIYPLKSGSPFVHAALTTIRSLGLEMYKEKRVAVRDEVVEIIPAVADVDFLQELENRRMERDKQVTHENVFA